jgi:Leucine-rich repeat (LRR) protein
MSDTMKNPDKPSRTWFRFSIRAMMLLVVAVAIVLGWQVNNARKQRAAVAAIQRAGGWVHYDYEFKSGKLTPGQSPWAPIWLRRMVGDELFHNVGQVSLVYDDSTGKRFDNGKVDACDDLLKQIAGLPGVKTLMLKETQATDEGMRQIGRMTGLEELYIWDARAVTDSGVAHLKSLRNLKAIHINGSNLTDLSLALLSSLPSMEEMSLQQNHFSDEGLARLKGKDRLTKLHIGLGGLRVTDAGLAHLKEFQKLEVLDIQQSEVSGEGLKYLKGLRNLKELWLSQTKKVSKAEADALQEAIPSLKILR